ncbi:MAG: STAS domain-containing protein [Akkermansiaceae bacterium]|jgi:anti-anti-sigma regulatory factor
MNEPNPIYSRIFDSHIWIRPEGRGTFQESAIIKELVERCLEQGAKAFVVDLEACPGMDSTFMGMLAGFGIDFRKTGRAKLAIVGTNEKTLASLKELGLQHLLVIEPANGPWIERWDEARSDLELIDLKSTIDREEHILECHQDLCEADEANFEKFSTVLEMLGGKRAGA